ncbi:hypothetical protein CSE45_3802 [Citreicella sp. SE45]|nr:hypothetical protein CSE45_3802 [Citreicella sp. SE45]
MSKSAHFPTVAKTLCSTTYMHLAPACVQDAWLRAKEDRGQPLTAAQLSRLEEIPSHYPARPHTAEAPFVDAVDKNDLATMTEVEAGHQRALPAIHAAVARKLGFSGGTAA